MPFFLNAKTAEKEPGEWQSIYRARRDVIVDGTAIHAGESLLVDRPTAAGLRACARGVREHAGARLLGICVFRIPSKGDSTTLTLPEIASALGDGDPRFSLGARIDQFHVDGSAKDSVTAILELENNGTAASRAGGGALTILVRVPSGCLKSVSAGQCALAEPVFESGDDAVRCALKRANAVKLTVGWWPPGAKLTAKFETTGATVNDVALRFAAILDNGSVIEGSRTLTATGMR
jgi:hypothetical protein